MTSGNFEHVDPSFIWVNRETRQRRELVDIDDLAASISRSGLINPPVITREGELVAGERRWTAVKMLGWTSIPVQWVDELSLLELHLIELEENVRRVDLTWQDQCAAVEKYHKLKSEEDKAWSQKDTAQALGMSQQMVGQKLLVSKALAEGVARVKDADKFSVALGVATRVSARKENTVLDSITIGDSREEEPDAPTKSKAVPLLNEDFREWAAAYTGTRFNLLHCDFPYGVNADKHNQGAAGAHGGYEDSKDVYFELLDTLEMSMSNVVADSAHMIFWFAMDYYDETIKRLTAMGWRVNPYPLIWYKSDNTGILPDPKRGPRRIYETAFFCSRGDRLLTGRGARANVKAHPGQDKEIHMSEKPVAMLTHFMEMICDEYSIALDPTAGSGNALKAATALGAPTVLGLEKDREFYERSVALYYQGDSDDL